MRNPSKKTYRKMKNKQTLIAEVSLFVELIAFDKITNYKKPY